MGIWDNVKNYFDRPTREEIYALEKRLRTAEQAKAAEYTQQIKDLRVQLTREEKKGLEALTSWKDADYSKAEREYMRDSGEHNRIIDGYKDSMRLFETEADEAAARFGVDSYEVEDVARDFEEAEEDYKIQRKLARSDRTAWRRTNRAWTIIKRQKAQTSSYRGQINQDQLDDLYNQFLGELGEEERNTPIRMGEPKRGRVLLGESGKSLLERVKVRYETKLGEIPASEDAEKRAEAALGN